MRTQTIEISAALIELGDLRWLLEQAEDLADDTRVSISVDRGDAREPGSTTLSITRPA